MKSWIVRKYDKENLKLAYGRKNIVGKSKQYLEHCIRSRTDVLVCKKRLSDFDEYLDRIEFGDIGKERGI